ncbi:MAG: calcium-binding protein [Marinibacterium sp.]
MANVNFSITLDGVTSFQDLNGNTIDWGGGYIGFVGLWPDPADVTTVDISITGSNWDMTTLRFGSKTDFTNLTDLDANGPRDIELIVLGQNSVVDLQSTGFNFLRTHDGASHDITLGSQGGGTVLMRGQTNKLTTGDGWVSFVEASSGSKNTVTVGQGGIGTLKLREGNDKVTVDGYLDQVEFREGNDRLIVNPTGEVGTAEFRDGNNRVTMTGDARVEFMKVGDANMNMTLSDNARVFEYSSYRTDTTITFNDDARSNFIKMDESTNTVTTDLRNIESIATWASSNTLNIGTGGVGQITLSSDRNTKQVINADGFVGQLTVNDKQKTTLTLGDSGAGTVRLSKANDKVTTGNGYVDFINTDAGKDNVSIGNGGASTVRTRDGNDTVKTNDGFVAMIETGNGKDKVTIGDGGAHAVRTGDGNDTLTWNGEFISSIDTGNGDDVVHAGTRGAGRVRLGDGDDVIHLQEVAAQDGLTINGSGGIDTADFAAFTVGITFALDGAGVFQNVGAPGGDLNIDAVGYFSETGVENIGGTNKNDDLRGDNGDNVLEGRGGKDKLTGLDGNDILDGGKSADKINGGNGMDLIVGGGGNDKLTGGADADTFAFAKKAGKDTVKDFEDGLDILQIANHKGGFKKLAIADAGNDLEIVHDGGTITLDGLAGTKLTKADFDFV